MLEQSTDMTVEASLLELPEELLKPWLLPLSIAICKDNFNLSVSPIIYSHSNDVSLSFNTTSVAATSKKK